MTGRIDFKSRKIRQVSVLYGSMILGIVLGVTVSVLNTRLLGPEVFGDYRFVQSVYAFFTVIISFGFVVTASKLTAENKNDHIRKELIGASVLITLILGFLFVLTMIIFSFFQKNFFATDLSSVFLYLSPFFFVIPFTQSLENILQGDNRIYDLAFYRIFPQLLYISGVFFLYFSDLISLETAVILQMSAFGISSLLIIYRIKPRFSDLKETFAYIFKENRQYGFQVYLGSVIGVASTQLGPIAISFFSVNNIDVGYYSLAMTITAPLMMIPTVVGTTMFKEFANKESIPVRSTKATVAITAVSLLLFLVIIRPLIVLLYSEDFLNAVDLAYIVSVGMVLHGFGNYYNRFLGSKGQGGFLRNGALFVGIANIAGFMLAVPFFGAYGAAYTKLFSGFVFIISMLYYYNKYKKVAGRCAAS